MNRARMNAVPAALFLALVLTACGSQSADSAAPGKAVDAAPDARPAAVDAPATSGDGKNAARLDPCAMLDSNTLATMFSAKGDIETRSSASKRGASCTWSWPRPDAEERRQNMVKAMMARMKSGAKTGPDDSSAYALNYTVRVELQDTHASADNFVPRKLSESELQAQIDRLNKRTQERLTERQKQAMAQTGMGGMAERLLRKANQREVIEGIGDAAYWVPVGNGSLHVLNGDEVIVVSSSLADDKQGSINMARKIYATLAR